MMRALSQRIENPRVGGSIPPLGTIPSSFALNFKKLFPTKRPISYKKLFSSRMTEANLRTPESKKPR